MSFQLDDTTFPFYPIYIYTSHDYYFMPNTGSDTFLSLFLKHVFLKNNES